MSTSLDQRRRQLRQQYGFDFPDDFFRFWQFVNRLAPLDPLAALRDALGITLVGPFEVLAGRFDGRAPRLSMLLHWRYYLDPPEFFTVLSGDTDGLHWGYYLDDPERLPAAVAFYWASDAFELGDGGDNLFEAVRLEMEYRYRDCEDYRAEDRENAAAYEGQMRQMDALRECLQSFATGDRPETSETYTERYAEQAARRARVTAATREGMGIVVPPGSYRPLSRSDRKLWAYLARKKDPAEVVEEARRALREGFPGTALKLGKDLWSFAGARKQAYAHELLTAAYGALGRDDLRHVLEVHHAHRNLPSVDVLEAGGS